MTKEELERLYMDIYDNGIADSDYKEKFKRYVNNRLENLEKENKKAKEIMNIAIEGIKHWGVVGGTERPFIKQAEMLFNLFLEEAERFSKDEGCPDCFCEDCAKDCGIKKLELVETRK